jgi:hypothetical protein
LEPNFIIVKSPDPIVILMQKFPELEDFQQDDEYDTFCAYCKLGEHLMSRPDDQQLWQRAYEFFELLATGGSVLRALLLEVFETLEVDNASAKKLRANVGPSAAQFLPD